MTVVAPSGIVGLSAGYNHSLAIAADGTLHAFGANSYRRLGDGTTTRLPIAVPVMSGL